MNLHPLQSKPADNIPKIKLIGALRKIFGNVAASARVMGLRPGRMIGWEKSGYYASTLMEVNFRLREHISDCQKLADEIEIQIRKAYKRKSFRFPPEVT